MGYARYIGRVGTLATALGVAAVVGNTPGVALADDLGANAPSSESSSESSKAGPASQPASDPSTTPDPRKSLVHRLRRHHRRRRRRSIPAR